MENTTENKTLIDAAEHGRLEYVKSLIENGADIHANNDYALRWSAQNGRLDVVKYLVENGADIHAGDNYALRWAAHNGHLDVAKYLTALESEKE